MDFEKSTVIYCIQTSAKRFFKRKPQNKYIHFTQNFSDNFYINHIEKKEITKQNEDGKILFSVSNSIDFRVFY